MASWGDYAVKAAYVVENSFPPKSQDDVYRLLVSLNLLNTVVKQPEGKTMTSYSYVKGMAACLFVWLMYHPLEGVSIYWNRLDCIAYFLVRERQFSFHYVPLLNRYAEDMKRVGLREQLWDGVRLQQIATDLFDDIDKPVTVISVACMRSLTKLMVHFDSHTIKRRIRSMEGVKLMEWKDTDRKRPRLIKGKVVPNKWNTLRQALLFDGRDKESFELRRPKDCWRARVICYTGRNYQEMKEWLSAGKPISSCQQEHLLEVGARYYMRRSDWTWRKLNDNRFLLLKAHYSCLTKPHSSINLCVTYYIARYLAMLYPDLRFINVLNYTRFKVHRRLYTYRDLVRVPLRSKSRILKVWMVVDKHRVLRGFDLENLPTALFREYEESEDYSDFFRKEFRHGCVGLVAYSRFHLLPPIYERIEIYGHFARIKNHCGKWAIYSLLRESFVSDFIYDSIWYDANCYAILGVRQEQVVIIHQLAVRQSSLEPTETAETL